MIDELIKNINWNYVIVLLILVIIYNKIQSNIKKTKDLKQKLDEDRRRDIEFWINYDNDGGN